MNWEKNFEILFLFFACSLSRYSVLEEEERTGDASNSCAVYLDEKKEEQCVMGRSNFGIEKVSILCK